MNAMNAMNATSPMDRWRDYDRVRLAIDYDAERGLRSTQDADTYRATLRSGAAWSTLCDALKELGPELVATGFWQDDVELAEGFQYLLSLVTLRLHSVLYASGPVSPAFVRSLDDVIKVGLDNPDGSNPLLAEIRDDRTYRIFGVPGTERYVEFVQSEKSGTLSNHFLDEFEVADDGTFELWLSP